MLLFWRCLLNFINKFNLNIGKYAQKITPLIIATMQKENISKICIYSRILDKYNYPMENIITTIICRIKSSLKRRHPNHLSSILEIIQRYDIPIEDFVLIAIERVDTSFQKYNSQEMDKALSIFEQIYTYKYTIHSNLYLVIQKWINIVVTRNNLNKSKRVNLLKKIDNFITYQTCQENMTQDQLIEINKFLQEQMRIIKTQKKTEISR